MFTVFLDAKEIKTSAKTNNLQNRKEGSSVSQQNFRKHQQNIASLSADNAKIKNIKEKGNFNIFIYYVNLDSAIAGIGKTTKSKVSSSIPWQASTSRML